MIFSFDTDVRRAETLLRHLADAVKDYPRASWPDLVCVLDRGVMGFIDDHKPAFSLYGLLGQDGSGPVAEIMPTKPCTEFEHGGYHYPTVLFEGRHYVVDVGRTYTGFLSHLYEMLLSKALIAQANLLRAYVPEVMRRCRIVVHEETPQ